MFNVNRYHLASIFILIILIYYVSVQIGGRTIDYDDAPKTSHDEAAVVGSYLNDKDDHLMWFVQISDLHISIFHNKAAVVDLEYFIDTILSLIKPKVVIATGDLTDAKHENARLTGQLEEEWKIYSSILNSTGILEKTVWLDIRGNHDNFDVLGKKSKTNLFNKYGVMKDKDYSYIYKLNMSNGDQYSFIGVDSCTSPGPRGIFDNWTINHYSSLYKKEDIEKIKKLDESSKSSNGTIWFGHFPTSTIYSPVNIRSVMSNGVAYLCGHLHTFGDILPKMYGRQSNGMLELELSDWKFNRKFRILAFDAGILAFRDFKFSRHASLRKKILVLITNPKSALFKTTHNREPLQRALHSTHIRLLIFSKHSILSAKVFIDNVQIGQATAVNTSSSPLYVLKWDANKYRTGMHRIKVIVEDSKNNLEIVSYDFALDDKIKLFSGFANYILTYDQIIYTSFYYWAAFSFYLGILLFFRFIRRRFTVNFISCNPFRTLTLKYLRRFSLLSSIDYIYWWLIALLVYVSIGPWFIAELFSNQYGVVFRWGILIEDHYIPSDLQNVLALLHMISFQLYLTLHLSYQIENRFVHLYSTPAASPSSKNSTTLCKLLTPLVVLINSLKWVAQNITFLLLLGSACWNLRDMYLCFSFISIILCPLKFWMPLIAIYLRYKCIHLSAADFDRFIDTSRLRKVTSTTQHNSDDQFLLEQKGAISKDS